MNQQIEEVANSDPPPICNKEAEEALLGAFLIDPALIGMIDIKPQDFYIHRHVLIMEALHTLRGKGIDYITLTEELERVNKLEAVGGRAYITGLINTTPTSLNAEAYAGVIRDKARRRLALETANALARAAYGEAPIVETSLTALSRLVFNMGDGSSTLSMAQAVSELYDEVLERMQHPVEVWGIRMGLLDVDRTLGGGQRGETMLIAGEPGIGKSKLLLQLAQNMAHPEIGNTPGIIFSPEMKTRTLARRAVSALAEVYTKTLKTGALTDEDNIKFVHAVDVASSLPIWIDDTPRLTVQQFRAKVARMVMEHDIGWVVLDYLQLVSGAIGKDAIEKSDYLSAEVQGIAREFDVFIVSASSVTKDFMDNGKVGMSGVRGSGQMLHDANIVAFMSKVEGMPNIVRLSFVKVREGDSGAFAVDLVVTSGYPKLKDAASRKLELGMSLHNGEEAVTSFFWQED